MTTIYKALTPSEIVAELDKHIIGQTAAKRAVAVAFRNRYRRAQVAEPLRQEITPKNILMIGPTGVGKTEIARRLAKLANAPFIKVEATKYTEIGYQGRDVDSIIRDLLENAYKMIRESAQSEVNTKAQQAATDRILDALMAEDENQDQTILLEQLQNHQLDDHDIEIEMTNNIGVEIMAPPGMEEMTNQLQSLFQNLASSRTKLRKMKIKEALRLITDEESAKLIDQEKLKKHAIELTEQNGIVFIDEIDKVTQPNQTNGPDVSREGVQRDLLPLIEGCSVNTKYGTVKTDHILFIASGAFHLSKPADLIPELQGRLPLRVELSALSANDFIKILTEPNASLTQQYQALLATEGVILEFTHDGIQRLAEFAWQVNERTENIGARRLHTVLERVLEQESFIANTQKHVTIDQAYVETQLAALIENQDLSQFIL